MSEFRAEAYFIKQDDLFNTISSNDKHKLDYLLTKSEELCIDIKEGFTVELPLKEQVKSLLNGSYQEKGFKNFYGFWILVHGIATSRPKVSGIPYPFLILDEIVEELEESNYTEVKKLLGTLCGVHTGSYSFPYSYSSEWRQPYIAMIDPAKSELLIEEIASINEKMKNYSWEALLDQDDWAVSLEEEDLHTIFDWIIEGRNVNKTLVIIVDGS
ncbi:MAG: hypothetical protein ACFB0B_05005 [Thermonemataceae bacterium]